MREFKLKSFDETEIYCTIWDDVHAPKGVVQLLHGMSEYGGHYAGFAEYLNSRGYIVFADDHRAHGRTETEKERGRHKGNIFRDTLKDELFFREWLKEQYDLPIFLAGHSYGSFLCQAFAESETDVPAIAIFGTGHMRTLCTIGKILTIPLFLVARNWRPKFVNFLSDNLFRFKGDKGKAQWINDTAAVREAFIRGEYTHTDMSVAFDYYMMSEAIKLYKKKNLAKLNPKTPIGIFCGTQDVVGLCTRGAKKLDRTYKECGVPSELRFYEGSRHEIVYGKNADRARADIADFFDRVLEGSSQSGAEEN
ncbi:MAG: alpha/beta hydrolase [Clostridia bacterium]|nr:alpha/beta hydrolase [Clostridia bacterium]